MASLEENLREHRDDMIKAARDDVRRRLEVVCGGDVDVSDVDISLKENGSGAWAKGRARVSVRPDRPVRIDVEFELEGYDDYRVCMFAELRGSIRLDGHRFDVLVVPGDIGAGRSANRQLQDLLLAAD